MLMVAMRGLLDAALWLPVFLKERHTIPVPNSADGSRRVKSINVTRRRASVVEVSALKLTVDRSVSL